MIFGTQFERTPPQILVKFDNDNLKTFEVIYKRDFKITSGNFSKTPMLGAPLGIPI